MSTTDTTTHRPIHPNGVDIEAILGARDLMTETPELAQFQFRAANQWITGVHSRTSFDDFFGVGGEQHHRRVFTFDADHPELFAATDAGPTPVEFVLHALASCITAGIASVAANRGITLHKVTSTIEGDLNLQGLMGIDADVRNGYTALRLSFHLEGDASTEELERLVAQSTRRSAVFDIVTNGTPVAIEVTA